MGWLFQYAIASLALGAVLVWLYDHTLGPLVSRVVDGPLRVGVFVGVWTAATAALGLRGVTKAAHGVRERLRGWTIK